MNLLDWKGDYKVLIIDSILTEEQFKERIYTQIHQEIDLGSLGVLMYLLTETEPQKFHKDILYSISKKNSKADIDFFWSELLEKGYLLEYHNLREESKHRYIVTNSPYSLERIKKYDFAMLDIGYEREE